MSKREYLYQYEDSNQVLLGTRKQIEEKTEYSYTYLSTVISETKKSGSLAGKRCWRTDDYNKIYFVKSLDNDEVKKLTHRQLERLSKAKKIPRHPAIIYKADLEIVAIKDTLLLVLPKREVVI